MYPIKWAIADPMQYLSGVSFRSPAALRGQSLLGHDRPRAKSRIGSSISARGCNSCVPQIVREADGYQAHLVSPEFGLRRLVDEAIGMVLGPVNVCVRRVHQVLLDAARCAACVPARGRPAAGQQPQAWVVQAMGLESAGLNSSRPSSEILPTFPGSCVVGSQDEYT